MEAQHKIDLIFLVHSLRKGFGGVETHQNAFLKYFITNSNGIVNLKFVIENYGNLYRLSRIEGKTIKSDLTFKNFIELSRYIRFNTMSPLIFFLNDTWWIEDIENISHIFEHPKIIIRTGGNDFEKAHLSNMNFPYVDRLRLYRDYFNIADVVISNSDFTCRRLLSIGVQEKKIVKIRGGINSDICSMEINKKSSNRFALIRKYNIRRPYIVTFACRFVPFKGIIPALNAIERSTLKDSIHILFVGDGTLRHDIENACFCQFKNLDPTFVGPLSNDRVIKVLAGSDVLMNPSINCLSVSGDGLYIHTETMGRTMMEALSVRTKIIATDVGGTKELFGENEGIGLLVKPTISSLKDAIGSIPTIIKEPFGFVKDYSWIKIFRQYEILFLKLCS